MAKRLLFSPPAFMVALLGVLLPMTLFTSDSIGQPYLAFAPASSPEPATHLLMVHFPELEQEAVTTQYYALSESAEQGSLLQAQALALFSQPDPPRCQTDGVYGAPTGSAVVIQYNCEDSVFARLVQVDTLNHTSCG